MSFYLTRSQQRVLNLLSFLKRPVSAQELHREFCDSEESMGLATVYRSLDALKMDGLVHVRTLTNGESVYTPIHQDQHHLTCLECGQSIPIEQCPAHELEKELQKSHRFKIYYHTLEFFGLCSSCRGLNPV